MIQLLSAAYFEEYISKRSALIDKEIEKVIAKSSEIPNLNDAIWYMLSSGGKRLRPAISLLCAEALGGNFDQTLRFGVAAELLHNYLLIHDDIEDGDLVRRNIPAIWAKFGLAHGINIGDFVCTKVYEAISSLRQIGLEEAKMLDLYEATIQCLLDTGRGQAMDLNARLRDDIDKSEYLQMTKMKTGAYLTYPIIGAAIICGANKKAINRIKQYGYYVGPAFQIRDDILDLTGGKGRGEIGCDIKEGKRSFMVVHTAASCTPEEKAKLFQILNKPREEKTPQEISWAIKLFEKYDAVKAGQDEAERLILHGKNKITGLSSKLQEVLSSFADFSARRLS